MAGLSGYDRVYRGRQLDSRQYQDNLSEKYYDRDFIRPLDLNSLPILSEENCQPDNGEVNVQFFDLSSSI